MKADKNWEKDKSDNSVALSGYDAVSYFTNERPLKGSGSYAAEHDGVTYLFSSEENKNKFMKMPESYVPVYDGYCAYGLALGKKFHTDPLIYEVVDKKLYLNKNKKAQGLWAKDINGHIMKADKNWEKIN